MRRDTAANWTSANSVLHAGELGIETDTLKLKIGNGATAWNSLAYGGAPIDTDGTFAANSDSKTPSQKAVKTYVDANAGGTNLAVVYALNSLRV